MKILFKLIPSLTLCLLIINAVSGQQNPADDVRFREWAQNFTNGRHQWVLESVEKDLHSTSPHPYACFVWHTTSRALGSSTVRLAGLTPELNKKLTYFSEIKMLDEQEQYAMLSKKTTSGVLAQGDFYLTSYMINAFQPINADTAIFLFHALYKDKPYNFRPLWQIVNLISGNNKAYRRIKEEVQSARFSDQKHWQTFLEKILEFHPAGTYDKIAAVETYLQSAPGDDAALRFKAVTLKEAEKFEAAISAYNASFAVNPFYSEDNILSVSECLLKLNKEKEAEEHIRRYCRIFHPGDTAEYYYAYWGSTLLTCGDKGRARQVLEEGLKSFPASAEINYQYGKTEAASKRHVVAGDFFEKSFNGNNSLLKYSEAYIENLSAAGRPSESLKLMPDIRAFCKELTINLYHQFSEVYIKMELFDEAITLMNEATSIYPESGWMMRQKASVYAGAGKPHMALEAIKAAHNIAPPTKWSLNFMTQQLDKIPDKKPFDAREEVNRLAVEFPYTEAVWDKLETFEKNNAAKKALWQKAMNMMPCKAFPVSNMRYYLSAGENWKGMDSLNLYAESLIDSCGSKEYELGVLWNNAVAVVLKLRKTRISNAELQKSKQYFNRYLAEGGRDAAYHEFMAELFEAADNSDSAKYHLLQAVKFRPDNHSLNWNLWTKYNQHQPFFKYIERDPYDGKRLSSFIQLNAMWSGSPIIAIQYSKLIKDIAPDKYNKTHEAMAYGQLGDKISDFEVRYARCEYISFSKRYVNWYESARKNAWKGSAKVEIDYDSCKATILFPDGTIAVRQDDPGCGKIKKLQSGLAYIEAEYNERGDMIMISSSAGKRIDLKYNEKGQITEIISGSGELMLLEYNENDRLSAIDVSNTGKMTITYNSEGEIEETNTVDVNGKTGDYSLATSITNSMNELLSLTRALEKSYDVGKGKLPVLGIENKEYENLLENYEKTEFDNNSKPNKKSEVLLTTATLSLAQYMYDHLSADAAFGNTTLEVLSALFRKRSMNRELSGIQSCFEAVKLYYYTLQKIRNRGLSSELWQCWIDMQEWTQMQLIYAKKSESLINELLTFQKSIRENPVVLLETSEWLPKSFLQIEGYWKKYPLRDLLPQEMMSQSTINTVFIASCGYMLAGTSKGLCVSRRGYWEWLCYDETKNEWVAEIPSSGIKASSNVLSIAETSGSEFLIGTANGLFRLGKELKGTPLKVYTEKDGLTSKNISQLADLSDIIAISTENGLLYLINDKFVTDSNLKRPLKFISSKGIDNSSETPSRLIAGCDQGVYSIVLNNGKPLSTKISDAIKDDAYIGINGEIYTLYAKEVTRIEQSKDPAHPGFTEVSIYGNIITTDAGKTYGFLQVPVNPGHSAAGVMTDLGISLYHERNFEHFYLPLNDGKKVKVKGGATKGEKTVCYSDDGLWVFERDRSLYYPYATLDLLTLDSAAMTLVADGSGIKVFDHNKLSDPFTLDYYSTVQCLTKESDTSFLAGNGKTLMRYTVHPETHEISNETLFDAEQYLPEKADKLNNPGPINCIVVQGKETIWVSTPLSVFRYYKPGDGEAVIEEFNFFRNEAAFPSRTDMIMGIYKTNNDKIRVVCSDEGHRFYKGIKLEGGLLEWDDKTGTFKRMRIYDEDGNTMFTWFTTSYTPLDSRRAILGTTRTGGFREEVNGGVNSIETPSYKMLKMEHPSLILGTEGIKMGDMWLFGCAEGVILYYNGIWLYPDKINQLLPMDIEFGNYGGRKVNAISADAAGRIYVGTDLGLLIYDAGGADALSFLLSNYNEESAILYKNVQTLQEEREILTKDIPSESETGKIIREIELTKNKIEQLEENSQQLTGKYLAAETDQKPVAQTDSISRLIVDLNKKHIDLLLKLEQTEPALFQAIKIPPIDLAASRKKLKKDECIIQYIPLSQKLFIQVLSSDKMEMREVNLSAQELLDSCSLLAQNLSSYFGDRGTIIQEESNPKEISMEVITARLSYLYEALLRPVENIIDEYSKIYIVPVKELSYIPFGALVNRQNNYKTSYAIEDYNIGYLSSMYLFDLIYNLNISQSENILLMGNPDKSLPFAEVEVNEISKMFLSKKLFVANNASLKNFELNAKGNKIIHLATHGKLIEESLKDSWLLFANGEKFNMSNAYNLPLDGTELVVLSACESGLGGKGLEYSTLARAFANAGAQSVLATLWEVNDLAAQEVMIRFYKYYLSGSDKFTALAKAQRDLIHAENKALTHPSKWSPFIIIGKP